MTQATAYFCPECGNSALEVSALVGGSAKCLSCDWSGKTSDLLVHKFSHEMGSADQMIELYARDVAGVLIRESAVGLGRVLSKWGFLDANHKEAKARLLLYLRDAGKAIAVSFVDTRRKLEVGAQEERPGDKNDN